MASMFVLGTNESRRLRTFPKDTNLWWSIQPAVPHTNTNERKFWMTEQGSSSIPTMVLEVSELSHRLAEYHLLASSISWCCPSRRNNGSGSDSAQSRWLCLRKVAWKATLLRNYSLQPYGEHVFGTTASENWSVGIGSPCFWLLLRINTTGLPGTPRVGQRCFCAVHKCWWLE